MDGIRGLGLLNGMVTYANLSLDSYRIEPCVENVDVNINKPMQEPTQEEKNQAMENIECWKTQEHLKECSKCAPVGNWKDIEEEFERVFARWHDVDGLVKPKVLDFFKPYFQEQLHEEAVEELESVDNQNTDKK